MQIMKPGVLLIFWYNEWFRLYVFILHTINLLKIYYIPLLFIFIYNVSVINEVEYKPRT